MIRYAIISVSLDIPTESIKMIKVSNPELPPENVASKFSRLDLSLNVDDKLVNVEIQMKMEPDYATERCSTGLSCTPRSLKVERKEALPKAERKVSPKQKLK